jgi:ATP-dependent DNA ligase I
MLFAQVVETSAAVASTASRLGKVGHLADCLKRASDEDDAAAVATVVAFLSGDLTQRQIGVGWASLREMPSAATVPTLTVREVDETFGRVGALSGAGSQAERRAALAGLFSKATESEQRFLYGLLSGELRQGALDGVMTDAIAKAAAIPIAEVRRAVMLRGSLGPVAQAALQGGSAALDGVGLQVGRPVKPMLAETAESLDAALTRLSRPPGKTPKGAEPTGAGAVADRLRDVALEWKIDGIRVQVHHVGSEVRVFTRTLDDVTARVPEIVEATLELPVRELVLDGEAVALQPDGRPHPFQDTASRTGSRRDIDRMRAELPLSTFFFDVLHVDGEDLLDRPADERHAALTALVPEPPVALAPPADPAGTAAARQVSAGMRRPPAGIGRIPRLVTADPARAAEFFADAVARGHEGVVVKSLDTPYTAGRRGAGWIKVKPRHTLDLVVLAAEWGHGRRRGWLSNLHLGARDPRTGEFVMLGKTFKGLTDKLLTWQTEQFLARAVEQDDWLVRVKPDLVVEIAFDGVQRSSRYPGGVTLRFARVLRYRPDKPPEEADTIDTVRLLGGLAS